MPIAPLPQKQSSLREVDFGHYIRHYLDLIWRAKWYIVVAAPTAALLVLAVLIRMGRFGNPPLPVTVLVGLESPATMRPARTVKGISMRNSRTMFASPRANTTGTPSATKANRTPRNTHSMTQDSLLEPGANSSSASSTW